jgi:hypothetical protein
MHPNAPKAQATSSTGFKECSFQIRVDGTDAAGWTSTAYSLDVRVSTDPTISDQPWREVRS